MSVPSIAYSLGNNNSTISAASLNEKNKAEGITRLCQALDTKPLPKKFPHILHQGGQFIFCNENYRVHNIVQQIKRVATNNPKTSKDIQVGVIVGGGHILSMLPEYSEFLDVLIFLDVNDQVLNHNRALIDLLLKCPDIATFKQEYPKKLKALRPTMSSSLIKNYEELLYKEQAELVDQNSFFLKDEKRYQECRAACAKMAFILQQIDLSNLTLVNDLLKTLDSTNVKTKIHLLNITNLPDLLNASKMQPSVNALCRDNPTILYSYKLTDGSYSKLVATSTGNANFNNMTKEVTVVDKERIKKILAGFYAPKSGTQTITSTVTAVTAAATATSTISTTSGNPPMVLLSGALNPDKTPSTTAAIPHPVVNNTTTTGVKAATK